MKRRKSIVAIALSVITAGSFLAAAPVKADSTLVIDSSNSPVSTWLSGGAALLISETDTLRYRKRS